MFFSGSSYERPDRHFVRHTEGNLSERAEPTSGHHEAPDRQTSEDHRILEQN